VGSASAVLSESYRGLELSLPLQKGTWGMVVCVADIMTPNPVTVTPRNAIRTAVNLMREGDFRVVSL